MTRLLCVITLLALSFLCHCANQDVLTILGEQSGVSTFTKYLEQDQDLVDILNNGTFTLLAPNDRAIEALSAQQPGFDQDADLLKALIQYHIVNGTHPSASFAVQPSFPATLLTSSNYTNVTGGQRVELTSFNGEATIFSGIKAQSHIAQADIFFIGGLIEIIDTVLTIPISPPATITQANLTDLVALLNKGGWVSPDSVAANIVNNLADITVWGPNSPAYGASFTGFNGLSQLQLDSIFEYSITQGEVAYSSTWVNNTKLPTLDKPFSLTLTQENGSFYADAAKIISTDYLTSNGVLQILDSPLNPNTTNTRPAIVPTKAASSSHGLSGTAAAGIGIGIGVVLIGAIIVAALVFRSRRNRRRGHQRGSVRLQDPPNEAGTRGIGMAYGAPQAELDVNRRSLSPQYHLPSNACYGLPPAYELENKHDSPIETPISAESTNLSQYSGSTRHIQTNSQGVPMTTVVEIQSSSPPRMYTAGSRGQPKPPSPQEIDGRERSRIEITVRTSGDAPRHLGFQARY